MEGPQFSTLAESNLYRSWGCSVIGMTAMPEAKLAREAEMPYAIVAMVTDYDCWHPDHDHVTVEQVIKILNGNADRARALIKRVAPKLGPKRTPSPLGIEQTLDTALITAPEKRDPDSRCRNSTRSPAASSRRFEVAMDFKSIIRTIPDYPKPGIMFRDVTTLLGNARAFRTTVDLLVQPYAGFANRQGGGDRGARVHHRGRGGASIVGRLRAGAQEGQAAVEDDGAGLRSGIRHRHGRDPRRRGRRRARTCLLVDDLIATGGTAEAAIKLIETGGRQCRRLQLHHRPAGAQRPAAVGEAGQEGAVAGAFEGY